MPFDDTPEEGGGGGHDPHDPALLIEMAKAALVSLSLNCDVNDACEFHAGVIMLAIMGDGLVNTIRKYEGDKHSLGMADDMIKHMQTTITALEEEKAKWQTTH